MKDEEMAEEYADNVIENWNYRFSDEIKYKIEQAFLAGLKAGRPKWHKVADGDLPKDDENFTCMLENGYRLECYYDPITKRWYDNFFHHDIEYGYYQSTVIAWCELPTFDKEHI